MPWVLPASQPWGGSQKPSIILTGDFRGDFVLWPPLLLHWAHPAAWIRGYRVCSSLQRRRSAFMSLPYLGSTFSGP